MKKQILKSLVFLGAMASASSALAATSIEGQVTIGTGSFSPSTKISLMVLSATTSYSATAVHLTGTKQYGTVAGTGVTKDPSKIYQKAAPTQNATAVIGVPTAPTASTDLPGSGWE